MSITLYAYLNIEHPMVAWEVAIGRLRSICDMELNNFGISLWQYSLFRHYAENGQTNKFINEFKLEKIRLKQYPEKVSRLQGLYFFKSEKDAHLALDRWRMPSKKKYISEVMFFPKKITTVDSEWITHNLNSLSRTDWMHGYWKGDTSGIRPLPEILASGSGVILNYELRQEAYKRIYELWPTSTPLLAAACCAYQLLTLDNAAITIPTLVNEKGIIKGSFYIRFPSETLKSLIY